MTRKLIIFNSSWKKWIITRIVRQNLSRNNQLTVSQFSLLLSKARFYDTIRVATMLKEWADLFNEI